ncbi:unnamed protein product [Closterium sp. NIES-65]|nr:unnamed protein product [Closterium sp. NIES-65]
MQMPNQLSGYLDVCSSCPLSSKLPPTFSLSPFPHPHPTPVAALLQLQAALQSTAPGVLSTWGGEGSPCEKAWTTDIRCDPVTRRVVHLDLKRAGLVGNIPTFELSEFDALTYLDLAANNFSAFNGQAFIVQMTKEDLAANNFSAFNGQAFIVQMTKEDLAANNFSAFNGQAFIVQMTSLQHLYVPCSLDPPCCSVCYISPRSPSAHNFFLFHGPSRSLAKNNMKWFPTDVDMLTSLTFLDLSNNKFDGQIPDDIFQLRNLEIPDDIFQLRDLEVLSVENNLLSWSVPFETSQKSSLRCPICSLLLVLSQWPHPRDGPELQQEPHRPYPQLPGRARDLSSNKNLTGPDLSSNKNLTGPIPSFLGELGLLQSLSLDDCDFTGGLLESLARLPYLTELFLEHNRFEGTIPEAYGHFPRIVSLYLSNNRLTGEIPESMCGLETAELLVLERNELTGPTICGLAFGMSQNALHLSNNHLTGEIPGSMCGLETAELLVLEREERGHWARAPVDAAAAGAAHSGRVRELPNGHTSQRPSQQLVCKTQAGIVVPNPSLPSQPLSPIPTPLSHPTNPSLPSQPLSPIPPTPLSHPNPSLSNPFLSPKPPHMNNCFDNVADNSPSCPVAAPGGGEEQIGAPLDQQGGAPPDQQVGNPLTQQPGGDVNQQVGVPIDREGGGSVSQNVGLPQQRTGGGSIEQQVPGGVPVPGVNTPPCPDMGPLVALQAALRMDSPDALQTWDQGSDPCDGTWETEVICDPMTGHVIRLDLRRANLSGAIPAAELAQLNRLTYLDLGGNEFSSFIQQDFLERLTRLEHLQSAAMVPNLHQCYHQADIAALLLFYMSPPNLPLHFPLFPVHLLLSPLFSSLAENQLQWFPTFINALTRLTSLLSFPPIPDFPTSPFPLFPLRLLHSSPPVPWQTISCSASWRRITSLAAFLIPSPPTHAPNTPCFSIPLPLPRLSYTASWRRITSLAAFLMPSLPSASSDPCHTLANNNFTGLLPESFAQLTSLQAIFEASQGPHSPLSKLALTVLHALLLFLSLPLPPPHPRLQQPCRQSVCRPSTCELCCKVATNALEGGIPDWLGSWPRLNHLSLFHNRFTGPIPDSLGNAKNLATLVLDENRLTGSLPDTLSALTNLEALHTYAEPSSPHLPLAANSLARHLPASPRPAFGLSAVVPSRPPCSSSHTFLCFLSALSSYSCSCSYAVGNQLEGTIPDSYSSLQKLRYMCSTQKSPLHRVPLLCAEVTLSRLKSLPCIVFLCSVLSDLSFNTKITGALPEFLSGIQSLESIAFEECDFTGSLPVGYAKLPSLTELYLDRNNLEGSIPGLYGDMPNLATLYLSSNRLSGEIPGSFCRLGKAKTIVLARNELRGGIPDCIISNLKELRLLDVSDNYLTGPVPAVPAGGPLQFDFSSNCLETSEGTQRNPCPSSPVAPTQPPPDEAAPRQPGGTEPSPAETTVDPSASSALPSPDRPYAADTIMCGNRTPFFPSIPTFAPLLLKKCFETSQDTSSYMHPFLPFRSHLRLTVALMEKLAGLRAGAGTDVLLSLMLSSAPSPFLSHHPAVALMEKLAGLMAAAGTDVLPLSFPPFSPLHSHLRPAVALMEMLAGLS